MVISRKRRSLRQFQNNFFAHNDAAGRAVRNETNDTPQDTRQEQQRKHISFEAAPTGRLAVSSLYYTVPHSPAKCRFGEPASQDAHDLPTDDFDFSSLNNVDEDIGSGKRKHTAGFIRLEGRSDFAQAACFCGEAGPMYRCQDCHGAELVCLSCTLHIHERQPLHRIECWNGTSFQTTMLKALGVRFQLGHPIGVQCVNPIPTFNDDFVILDYNGVHEVGLDFCGSATFRVLEYFQMLSFESKVSAWEFYNTVARLTDNTGTRVLKDRYASLLRMIREWRFVMQMKRCGQGHHPGGIQATEASACAILCPACPHPSRNLPVGWENSPSEFQFLYAIFLAIDANFRLVRRNVLSDAVDPGLNHGYTFFVEETAYKDFLASHYRVGNPQEKSTCSSHSAVNLADTRASRGLVATGAGTVDCARHNFKRPCSVGDLQKGERYINMDYLFFSSMRSSQDIHILNISYDIACQWNKNLWLRMSTTITRLSPHIASCQTKFSFNFIKGVGRTDGEAPERGWADINLIATSTREMGPGSRRDTLDDHFNDWNWKKVCSMGTTLLRKYKAAIPEVEERASDLKEFEAALDPDQLATWRKEIEMWESDRSLTNPFKVKARTTVTQAAVRLALSKAEAEEIEHGGHISLDDDISPSVLISSGMELEDQQRCVEFEARTIGQHATDVQKLKILQHINALRRRISTWSRVQLLYMPYISCLRSPNDIASEDKAQANDALDDLRTYKNAFVRGQRTNTRAQGIIHSAESRINTISAKYTAARDALIMLASKLGKNDDWQRILKPLDRAKDAVPLNHDEGKTVGQQNISWIWKTPGVSNNQEEGLQDSLCVEWCKAQAWAYRWEEEVQLLCEEMCHAQWWDTQGSRRQFSSPAFTEGAVAYAHRQAMLRQRMSAWFRSLWDAVLSWTAEPPVD
ncbi:uncharacterized protein HD556DRAFT_1431085 [Suillus plorans]|uniref:CxC2-like cysteine cluster KDZ transposase-associated domain-containing protein n=1 Tax=Suillus plorans TaxID=116603 RepID=A0A9P7DKT9_9AGAM|nr:uncharacterized protein HD556DRAFT_1431085 [Suillus plorans]KAG1797309.1 hypothetical protein HD556DRAFT_1431085 [Suillus plorans]